MKKSRKFVLALTGLAVLCVCAAMAAPLAMGDGTGQRGMMKGGTVIQGAVEKMQADGIDTTALKTALENGDREAVRAFMQANRPADASEKGDGQMHAMNKERMQEMIQRMQANGIDTIALETALENGDQEAVRAFMQANRPADAPEKGDGQMHAVNKERMQKMIQKMQANGVDTTVLETALENGDRKAVHAFMEANRPADAPEKGDGQMHAMNEERMQQMIQKMQANGVDTTALETALESGDREAVHAFMEANRPADAPEKGNGQMHAMNEERMQANGPADAGTRCHRGGPSGE